jgi:hypothetical protein
MPHDLVRESFEPQWFLRDATQVDAMRWALMEHLEGRIRRMGGDETFRFTRDWIYLVRDTPIGRFLGWRQFDSFHADNLRSPDDAAAVEALTARMYGPVSAGIVRHWLARQPHRCRITRDRQGRACGYALLLDLTDVTAADAEADPGAAAALALVARRRPLQPGDLADLTRFVLHESGDDLPNPSFDLATLEQVSRMLTEPRLAWSIHIHPERLAPLYEMRMRYHWHHHAHDAAFELDGHRFGVFMRDWKAEPNPAWRAVPEAPPAGHATAAAPLTRDEFAAAVRDALRNHSRPDKLQTSPLLHAASLRKRSSQPDIEALRTALVDAVHALAQHPADRKFHNALRLTWLDPGASQEKVAAELGLPFNTYRYHLARGLDRVVQALWERELRASRRK